MEGLTEGRIVHYIQQLPQQVGTTEYAAIVSKVYQAHDPEVYPAGSIESCADRHQDGDVMLHVFTENSVSVRHSVRYSSDKLPNTWHWIEKA